MVRAELGYLHSKVATIRCDMIGLQGTVDFQDGVGDGGTGGSRDGGGNGGTGGFQGRRVMEEVVI